MYGLAVMLSISTRTTSKNIDEIVCTCMYLVDLVSRSPTMIYYEFSKSKGLRFFQLIYIKQSCS